MNEEKLRRERITANFAVILIVATFGLPVNGQPTPEIVQWTTPEPGWLFLLDSESSRIFLVDPTAGTIKGTISTGNASDFALSHDGGRLYVTSSQFRGSCSPLSIQEQVWW